MQRCSDWKVLRRQWSFFPTDVIEYVDTYTKPPEKRPPPVIVQPPSKKRRVEAETAADQSRRDKLAAAREITEKRLQKTKKQIYGVSSFGIQFR